MFPIAKQKSNEWSMKALSSKETKDTLHFVTKSTWGVPDGPSEENVLTGMAVMQQHWVQHRAC